MTPRSQFMLLAELLKAEGKHVAMTKPRVPAKEALRDSGLMNRHSIVLTILGGSNC